MNDVYSVPDIIPFYIYHREHENKYLSYIQNGLILFTKEVNKISLLPKPIPKTSFYKSFFAINPMFRPIPPKTSIVCFKLNSTFPFNIIDVFILYDPYDIESAKDSVCCITWLTPIPNTIPMFLYKNYIGIYCTFEKNDKYGTELDISPIYVMEKEFQHFKYDMGRCLPNDDTSLPTLNECELKNDLSLQKEITIFDIIQPKQNKNLLYISGLIVMIIIIFFIFYKRNIFGSARARNTFYDINRNNSLVYKTHLYSKFQDR